MANLILHKYPNCRGCGFLSQCPIEVCLGWELELKAKEEKLLADEIRVQQSIKAAKEAASKA